MTENFTDVTFGEGALYVDLGDGTDSFRSEDTNAATIVHGGPGPDTFEGGLNVDHFFGGDGDDTLKGMNGADELRGEGGNDTLVGDWPSEHGIFADVIDGGDGVDTLKDYVFSGEPTLAPPIAISLDGQANDGRAGRERQRGLRRAHHRQLGRLFHRRRGRQRVHRRRRSAPPGRCSAWPATTR